MSNALELFQKRMNEITALQKSQRLIEENWLDEIEARLQRNFDKLEVNERNYELAVGLEEDLQDLKSIKRTLEKEPKRIAVVTMCAAFESFLRLRVVEEIMNKPHLFQKHVKNKLIKPIRQLKALVPTSTTPIEPTIMNLVPTHLSEGHVDEYIVSTWPSVGSFKKGRDRDVEAMYRLIGVKPFTRVGEDAPTDSPFATELDRIHAYVDIRLMFVLRHQLLHRHDITEGRFEIASEIQSKYESDLNEISEPYDGESITFRHRLNQDLQRNNPAPRVPFVHEIIESQSDKGRSKVDEFHSSVGKYARYIDQLAQQRTGSRSRRTAV